ncbi:capsule biosynthesis GfcC family protein [Enterovibrio calviensis]|uniref:capsule biosynthesis GfcC family protein n=1 Tax=Enterovibrio calviensis TaxID=91359 RepID=UPI000483CC2A|nr:capsule biosynthesis GfcC family protein [Enterovibrio calviensis]
MKLSHDRVSAPGFAKSGEWVRWLKGVALLLCSLFATSTFATTLMVQQTAQEPLLSLSFSQTPRLSQVVIEGKNALQKLPSYQETERSHQSDGIFWPAAALLDNAKQASVEQLKTNVTDQLFRLYNEWAEDADKKQAIDALLRFIEAQDYGFRVDVNVDHDGLLLGQHPNPLLDSHYTLLLPSRPSSIDVLGAIQHSASSDWASGLIISDYIDNHDRLFWYAERSHVVVIEPNGNTQSVPVAYWNNADSRLVPGSIVYVPFTSLPSTFDSLNTTIVNLLKLRMM